MGRRLISDYSVRPFCFLWQSSHNISLGLGGEKKQLEREQTLSDE